MNPLFERYTPVNPADGMTISEAARFRSVLAALGLYVSATLCAVTPRTPLGQVGQSSFIELSELPADLPADLPLFLHFRFSGTPEGAGEHPAAQLKRTYGQGDTNGYARIVGQAFPGNPDLWPRLLLSVPGVVAAIDKTLPKL